MNKKCNRKINITFVLIIFILSTVLIKIFSPISYAFTSEERIEELKILDSANKERLTLPVATIDFVQPYLIGDYSETEMDNYVKMLKRAGYEAVIIQNIMNIEGGKGSSINITASWYDSKLIQDKSTLQAYKPAMLDTLVKAIQDNDMKIYIGLASTNDWWNSNFTDEEWRTKNTDFANEMINELYQKYNDYSCFEGIYWTNEIYTNGDNYYEYWSEMINSNIEYLHKIDVGEKKHKFMISPFVSQIYDLTYEQVYKDWKKMVEEINFRQGDIICVQDGLGTSSFEPSKVEKYLEALQQAIKNNEKNDVEFWLNVENYEQINGEGKPSPLERYILQLSICSRYAEGLTSFSYSHYYNPSVTDANYDEQYRQYYNSVMENAKESEKDDTSNENNNEKNDYDEELNGSNQEDNLNKSDQNDIDSKIDIDNKNDKSDKINKVNTINTVNKDIPQCGESKITGNIIFAIIIFSVLFIFAKYKYNQYK